MPYYFVGSKELRKGSIGVKPLLELLGKKLEDGGAPPNSGKLLEECVLKEGLSFLVSTAAEGEPKAFLSFKFPSGKGKPILTETSYTAKKYRSYSAGRKRKGFEGGEQIRLFYRLAAIARQKGITEIEAPFLLPSMVDFYRKIRRNPRPLISIGEIDSIPSLRKELARARFWERGKKKRMAERVTLLIQAYPESYGIARVAVNRKARPAVKRLPK
jgi:hypothetical protein